MANIKYNIPENVYQGRQEHNRLFRKARNSAMNNVFSKYGIPKNMGNKEIKRRVKYHNWFARKAIFYHRTFVDRNNKYIEFLMNDKVFNENKRKSLVILSLELNNGAVMAVRSPVVVSYLLKLVNLFQGTANKPAGFFVTRYFTRQLKSFGKFREDAAMIAMLKKRINFLRKLRREYFLTLTIRNLNRLMDDMFPIPPHPKGNTAAKTIQKRARGMINRTTVKKMKTVAGRVSLTGKR
jgi:hypothetical protein